MIDIFTLKVYNNVVDLEQNFKDITRRVMYMGRTTIKDVAREAGVSMSTVNKALTGKSGISKELKKKILETVNRLDYKPNQVAGSIARKSIRIGIILPSDWEDYYNDICDGINYEMERLIDWKVEGITLKFSVKDNDASIQALHCFEKIYNQGIKAVVFCHGNYSTYREALDFAEKKKIRVICVGIGALDQRSYFSTIEVDAYRCGRIAAEMLEQYLPEKSSVGIVLGSKSIFPHMEKIRGFSDRLEEGGRLKLKGCFETQDNDDISYNLIKDAIDEKSIDGIFVATGATSGVCKAVEDCNMAGRIKLVTTDLSHECRKYIDNGVVNATIYQNTFLQGVRAVDMFYKFFSSGASPEPEILIPPMIFTKESLLSNNKKSMYTYVVDF